MPKNDIWILASNAGGVEKNNAVPRRTAPRRDERLSSTPSSVSLARNPQD